jgi:phosphopantothenate synthetase
MEKSRSKALAFFNLLKTLIPSDIKNQSLDYKFSLDDLEEKVEMDKKIISSLIENLEHDGFINILNETSSEVNLHFERTYDKLIEVFSVEGIEDTIERMQDFVQKKIDYFDIDKIPVPLEKYIEKAIDLVKREGMDADLNPIIEEGIKVALTDVDNLIRIKKIIYKLCEDATEEDLDALELILFCQLNFPLEENPFYVVLFLSRVCYELEKEKVV